MDELFNTISPEELAAAMDEVMWLGEVLDNNAQQNVYYLRTLVEALKRMSRS